MGCLRAEKNLATIMLNYKCEQLAMFAFASTVQLSQSVAAMYRSAFA